MRKRAHGLCALRGSKFRGGEFDPAQFCPQAFASRVRAGRKPAKASSAGTRPGRQSCRSFRLSGFLPPGLCPHTLASRVGGDSPPKKSACQHDVHVIRAAKKKQAKKRNIGRRLHVLFQAGAVSGRPRRTQAASPPQADAAPARGARAARKHHTEASRRVPKHFLFFEAGLHAASARRARFARTFCVLNRVVAAGAC